LNTLVLAVQLVFGEAITRRSHL